MGGASSKTGDSTAQLDKVVVQSNIPSGATAPLIPNGKPTDEQVGGRRRRKGHRKSHRKTHSNKKHHKKGRKSHRRSKSRRQQ